MPLLINREVVQNDPWQFVTAEAIEAGEPLPVGSVAVPLAYFVEHKANLLARSGEVGVTVNGGDDLQALIASLADVSLVAVEFPVFRDGRGFSIARKVVRAGFKGEVRAVGDVGRDRLEYMESCGFNAFEVNGESFSDDTLKAFTEISVNYQGTAADPRPIFRR